MHFKIIASLLFVTMFSPSALFTPIEKFQAIENPLVIESRIPTYPSIALTLHAAGTVLVEVEVDSSGKVIAAKAISGPPILRVASRDAALAWRFGNSLNPTVNQRLLLTFDFYPELSTCEPSHSISRYHVTIRPSPPPETVSFIDNTSKSYCQLHGTRLLRDRVEIIYGLVEFKAGYEKAEKNFPNANVEAFGGCLIEKEVCNGLEIQLSPKYAEVLYCRKCRRAHARWIQKQKTSANQV
jgi:hypothetical protein